jgi:hypothetical protein
VVDRSRSYCHGMAMDDKERMPDEEQVEDLDTPESDAENVKGGRWFLKIEGTDGEVPPPPPPK